MVDARRARAGAGLVIRREQIEAALDAVCSELGDDDLDVVREVATELRDSHDRWIRQLAELRVARARARRREP